ncbi:DUF4097 family beta strand repeat-containing protein [Bacillus solimangrovi]|uniref:DUF4097 domain-containing protein n=1 Tax=Bacillus solimangrovi TaxID=1305675 RepID=A0A1E5LJZ4_9BACI|nr:DUF4097 family beta strand repeat-containing protein [Bacillus solimangrovi]OEH94412.1 hypothetical protein BFG57_08095 [Bacillus solimangrovi]
MRKLNNRMITLFSIGFMVLLLGACNSDSASNFESKSFEGGNVEEIYVKADGQNIEVRPSNDSTVKVNMEDVEDIPATVEGNVLKVNLENSSGIVNLKTKTLYLDVPNTMYKKISLISTSGNISGEGLKAEELVFTTDSGNISINGIDSNKLFSENVAGNVELENANGDFVITNQTGNIILSHNGMLGSDSNINTLSGKIVVNFNQKPNSLIVDAATESGKIKTSLFAAEKIISQGAGNKLQSELGANGPKLSIHTLSGSINLD